MTTTRVTDLVTCNGPTGPCVKRLGHKGDHKRPAKGKGA